MRQRGQALPSIPPNFARMRLEDANEVPRMRFRLDAQLDSDGDMEGVIALRAGSGRSQQSCDY